jgi:hypothetical protein
VRTRGAAPHDVHAMYAQLIELPFEPERLAELERVVRFELLPALRAEPGFSGATQLLDQPSGRALLVVLWETEDEAHRPLVGGLAPFQLAFATILNAVGSDRLGATVWEVRARA